MEGDALKGHLDLLLLAIVRRSAGHGYAIIEELRRRSDGAFDLAEGTIYPALHRLERAGLLQSRWEEVGGRRRRAYSLTRRGENVFLERHRSWRAFAVAVAAVVGVRP